MISVLELQGQMKMGIPFRSDSLTISVPIQMFSIKNLIKQERT